jgi:formate dehydrogenase major subunit
MVTVTIDGGIHEARGDERLIDLINRTGTELARACYHPQLGPIQTCDTCLVETNARLVRACGTNVSDGMTVLTKSAKAGEAQRQAFDRILSNHLLYCTVCDKNNGNCTVHNTESLLAIEHRAIPFHSKPFKEDHTNPFYRYDPQWGSRNTAWGRMPRQPSQPAPCDRQLHEGRNRRLSLTRT